MIEQFDGSNPFKDIDLDNDIGVANIKKFYDDELFCKMKGNILITKVTGQLSFRLKGEKHAYQKYISDAINREA